MAKKRANGEGNIRKRADGRWEGRYTAGYHPETGKRIIKNVLGKTQAECKAKLSAAMEANVVPRKNQCQNQNDQRNAAVGTDADDGQQNRIEAGKVQRRKL